MEREPDEPDELAYLNRDDALEIYAAVIGCTAAQAADHLRSRDGLEGALGRPSRWVSCGRPQRAAGPDEAGSVKLRPGFCGVLSHTRHEGESYRPIFAARDVADWIAVA